MRLAFVYLACIVFGLAFERKQRVGIGKANKADVLNRLNEFLPTVNVNSFRL